MTTSTAELSPTNERETIGRDLRYMEGEKDVLRWGGLAGILGSIVFLLVFAIVIVFVGPEPARTEGFLMRFPDVRAAHTVENSLYLTALLLYVIHVLALHRALRGTSAAPALFGSALAVLGLGVLAVGAIPHIVQTRLSDIYHAPGATPGEQESVVLMWEVSQGIFDTLLVTGLFIVPMGYLLLGVAMFGAPAFSKWFGSMSVGLGVAGIVAVSVLLTGPVSEIAAVGIFALIVFHLVVGWKVYSLSGAS